MRGHGRCSGRRTRRFKRSMTQQPGPRDAGMVTVAACNGSADWLRSRLKQIPKNLPCQEIVDFAVPRDGLRPSRCGVVVDVVLGSMPEENAPSVLETGDEIASLQATSSSSSFLMPGISSARKGPKEIAEMLLQVIQDPSPWVQWSG